MICKKKVTGHQVLQEYNPESLCFIKIPVSTATLVDLAILSELDSQFHASLCFSVEPNETMP